jgi:hypothetical protein
MVEDKNCSPVLLVPKKKRRQAILSTWLYYILPFYGWQDKLCTFNQNGFIQ